MLLISKLSPSGHSIAASGIDLSVSRRSAIAKSRYQLTVDGLMAKISWRLVLSIADGAQCNTSPRALAASSECRLEQGFPAMLVSVQGIDCVFQACVKSLAKMI
jgi:hypothetical protein